jgi:hypothetical protein
MVYKKKYGNDLLTGYEGENLGKVLYRISTSQVVKMDRWQIEFSAPESGDDCQGDPIPCNIINNYFSIGVVSTFTFTNLSTVNRTQYIYISTFEQSKSSFINVVCVAYHSGRMLQ